MPPREWKLHTRDGLELACEHHGRPEPRGTVVILHGYAEYAGRYRHVIAALDEAGYECHLLDLRGHGHSDGVRGYVARFEDYFEDVDLFLEKIREVHLPGLPLILLGHSLGGLISLGYVLRRPEAFHALAVSSPFLHPAMEIPVLKAGLAAVASHLMPTYLAPSDLDSRGLSHDPAVVAAYDQDPLIFKTFSPHWFFQVRRVQEEVFERAAEIRLPALFLIGGSDPVADPDRSRAVFERLGSPDKHLQVYPGLFHEVFNEVERARVVQDLLSWLNERAPSSVTSAGPPPAR
jgi:acylglycerol lipase